MEKKKKGTRVLVRQGYVSLTKKLRDSNSLMSHIIERKKKDY